jgi:tetratricopeptide (TPR) repeat protein
MIYNFSKSKWGLVILFSTVFLGLNACKSPKKIINPSGLSSATKEELKFEYSFHNAIKEKILGNFDISIKLFEQCIKINPLQPAPYFEVASIFNFKKQNTYALNYAKKATELSPNNFWYQKLYTEILINNNRYKEAIKVAEKMAQIEPNKIEIYYLLAELNIQMKNYAEAAKYYEIIQEKQGVEEKLSIEKIKLYIQLNDKEKLENEFRTLEQKYPENSNSYKLMYASYVKLKDRNKAYELYKECLVNDPNNGMVHMELAIYYFEEKNAEKMLFHMKETFRDPTLVIEQKINLLIMNYFSVAGETFNPEVLSLTDTLMKVHPKDYRSYTLASELHARNNDLKNAAFYLDKALEIDADNPSLWGQLLVYHLQASEFKKLIETSKKAIEFFPLVPEMYLFNGIGYISDKNAKEAISPLQTGVELVVENPILESEFYQLLGDAFNQTKDYKKSDDAYNKSLEINPNNELVLNNYAYYLSLRKENLEKAAEMAKKANDLSPNSASYQDTYAWVLFQQENYTEAKVWILKALNQNDVSAEVFEHAGDIFYKNNEVDQALVYWKKALEKSGDSETLKKKISNKKIVE